MNEFDFIFMYLVETHNCQILYQAINKHVNVDRLLITSLTV